MAECLSSGSGSMAHPDGFHILAELVSAESLTSPIKASGRIKYTCIAVSKHYIGLGASSGSLYIFHRNTLKYLQVFSNTEGALTSVAFAPNDNIVGIATSHGLIITWELNIERRVKSERLAVSSAHRNGHVTAMVWDAASERLFSGDNHGRITFTNVYHRKMSGLFKLPTELVMDADSAIVQLDYCDDKLLASTTTKCFICDTKKKQAYAVGTKPRDGQFGACFLQKATKEFPLVYSARPGSRIWEVNIVGQVQATHQFKHLLAVPALPVVGPGRSPVLPGPECVQKSQSLCFSQLLTFGHGYNLLLTWNSNAIYVFDPAHIKVMVWSTDFKDILWACVYKSRVYCLHPNSQVKCYTLLSAERCISRLFALSLWEQCAQAAVYFAERVKQGNARRYVPCSLIQEVNYQLMDGNADVSLIGQLEELLSNMEEDGLSTPGSSRRSSLDSFEGMRLDSGIYVVRNRAGSDDSVEDFPVQRVQPAVVDRQTQMGDGIERYDTKYDGVPDSTDSQGAAMLSGEVPITKTSPVVIDEESQMDDGIGELNPRHDGIPNVDNNWDTAEVPREKVQEESQESREEETVGMAETHKDFEEDVEVACGFDFEEDDDDMEGPAELGRGPAGINWGFGQGRLGLRRESSLLEEIAEKTAEDPVNALVKDGELDSSIAESLNSSTDDPVTNTQIDTQTNDPGESWTPQSNQREGRTTDGLHGKPKGSANRDKASFDTPPQTSTSNTHGAKSNTTGHFHSSSHSSSFSSTDTHRNDVESHSKPDQSGTGPNQPISASGQTAGVSSSATRDHSQMGPSRPSETSSMPESSDGGGNSALDGNLSHEPTTPVPEEQASYQESLVDVDFRNRSFTEVETDNSWTDWPAIKRTLSMPTANQSGPFPDERKARKQSCSSKDKKRSKKSRIIDLDKPQHSPQPDQAQSDSAFAAAMSRKDGPQQSSRNPSTSTLTKRSQSLSSVPPVLPSPTAIPSKRPSQPEFPPHSEMDFSRSGSFGSDPMMDSGLFDANEEVFWSGTPMMFPISGPKLAAQFLVPSFSAMKESLSSTLVKTKTFLKQMSEPEIGSLPVVVPVTTTSKEATVQLLSSPHEPFPEPAPSPHASPSDAVSKSVPQSPDIHVDRPLLQSALPSRMKQTKIASLDQEAGLGQTCVDEELEKEKYCVGLTDDDVIKKLALATWEAKHKLQDPGLSLRIDGCRNVLENWLQELCIALASKNRPPHIESYEEVQEKIQTDHQPLKEIKTVILEDAEDLLEENAIQETDGSTPSSGRDCPVQSNHDLAGRELEGSQRLSSQHKAHGLRDNSVNFLVGGQAKSGLQLRDPFDLPASILKDLRRLAMLCFEMAVFGGDATPADSTSQSDRLSDDERSRSFQDGESSSPETDQSHPLLDPNLNSLLHAASVTPHVIGRGHHDVQIRNGSVTRTNQSNSLSHNAAKRDGIDCNNQGCVSMETERSMAEKDRRSASFVESVFFLLDVEGIREILKWRDGWRKQTMAVLLECLQTSHGENELDQLDSSRLVQVIKSQMLKGNGIDLSHIHRFIQHGQVEMALEVMLEAFPDLLPWEVMHLTQADTVPADCFLEYVTALLESVEPMDRDTMLASICSDQEVRCHLLTSALSQGAPAAAELFCQCGNLPRPGSHVKEWRYSSLADQILSLPATSKDRLLSICIQHGYWCGVLRLCLDLQQREQALRTGLQLADIQLFSGPGVLPASMDEWVLLLNLMSQSQPVSKAIQCLSCSVLLLTKEDSHWLAALATDLPQSDKVCDWSDGDSSSKPECDWLMDGHAAHEPDRDDQLNSDWSPSVTWESIATLLVKSVGPGLATRMLVDTSIPCGELPRDFFMSCISTSMIEKLERNVCLGMLEGLDTYLWSKRNNVMAPPLYHRILQERALTVNNEDLDEASVLEVRPPATTSMSSCQYVEDHDCHWGTNVLLNSDCEVCGHPLSSSVSSKTTGLLAFTCGHTFHSACVVERACVLCYELNCQKTFTDNRNV